MPFCFESCCRWAHCLPHVYKGVSNLFTLSPWFSNHIYSLSIWLQHYRQTVLLSSHCLVCDFTVIFVQCHCVVNKFYMAMFTKQSKIFYLVDTNYYSLPHFLTVSRIPHLSELSQCEWMEIKYKLKKETNNCLFLFGICVWEILITNF